MSTVEATDGVKIYYRAQGSGPPLLLCNASFATHAHWTAQQEALAEDFCAVTWDYRGHGRSETPLEDERYSLEQVVEDLRVVHEAVADAPAVVGGLSLGGLVAMAYALAYPTRVRALLLFNTGPGFKNPEALAQWRSRLERAASKLEEVGVQEYLEGRRAQAELLGNDPTAEAARLARDGVLSSSAEGLARFARRVAGPVPNLVDRLEEIQAPSLILVGEQDEAFQRASQVLAAKLSNAERRVLKRAGHVLQLDEPDAFLAEIRRFLDSLPRL